METRPAGEPEDEGDTRGRHTAESVMSARHRRRRHELHVFRDAETGRWTVASAGRRRARHRRQATAVRAAIRTARRRRVDVNTHARNGRIRAKEPLDAPW